MVREAIGNRECLVSEIKDRISDLSRFLELTNHKPGEAFSVLKVGQHFGRLRDRWFGGYRLVWGKSPGGKHRWQVEETPHQKEMHRAEEEPL